MNIVFSTDDNYAPLTGVAIFSILESEKYYKDEIKIFILDGGVSHDNKLFINKLTEHKSCSIVFIDTRTLENEIDSLIKLPVRSLATWYRIFLPRVLPDNVKKVIYLDCDSYINDTLQELWEIDMESYDVAGVLDIISEENKAAIGLKASDPYINAGMLVINVDRWRKEGVQEKLIDFINKKKGKVAYHDQGTINAICRKKKILHPKFNAMTPFFVLSSCQLQKYHKLGSYYSEKEITEAKQQPVFCHLTPYLVDRPWAKGNFHPLQKQYMSLANRTVWGGKVLTGPTSYLETWKKSLFHYSPFWFFLFFLSTKNSLRTSRLMRKLFNKPAL